MLLVATRISLEQFISKIIIIVDKSNPIYIDTKLDELVNITSNSIYLRLYRNDQLNIGNYTKDLIEFNKYNMTVILPELSRSIIIIIQIMHLIKVVNL